MPKPDFLIVGAPKSGTTAMCHYLAQHPEIFMPAKECHFFGSDLIAPKRIKTVDEYIALFRDGQNLLCGESSVWYLFSQQAASEIFAHNPEAKIIIMIRNPVDLVYSLHNQRVYIGVEDVEDFEQAIALDDERRQGFHLPRNGQHLQQLNYHDAVLFSEQIQRYLQVFGREHVHIIIYDDLRHHTAGVYRNVLSFLEVDPDFQANFQVVNPSKYVRSKSLRTFIRNAPEPVQLLVKRIVPVGMRNYIRSTIMRINTRVQHRPPMPMDVRKRLQETFSSEVERLSVLIERDLTHWNNESTS